MLPLLLTPLLLFSLAQAQQLPYPYNDHCIIGEKSPYNPSNAAEVPWFIINLDDPPEERWAAVAVAYKDQLLEAMAVFQNFTYPLFKGKLWSYLVNRLEKTIDYFDQPYRDEIKGMAKAAGRPVGELVFMNTFYELSKACTSIVAEDLSGKLWHARNQDFGWPVGWDAVKHDFKMSEQLRKLLINVIFLRDGKVLYKGNTFAGLAGVLTAVRPKMYTMSFNARQQLDFIPLIEWMNGMRPNTQFLTLLAREVMEKPNSYQEVVDMIKKQELIAAGYFIIGGNSTGQGTVITRGSYRTVEQRSLNASDAHEGWFVLQTNYDWDKKPLFLDDRRTPGMYCMHQMGRLNIGFQSIYDVLSSKPNFNKNTVYTTLMQVDSGKIETYIRFCEDPCWFV